MCVIAMYENTLLTCDRVNVRPSTAFRIWTFRLQPQFAGEFIDFLGSLTTNVFRVDGRRCRSFGSLVCTTKKSDGAAPVGIDAAAGRPSGYYAYPQIQL